MWVSGKMVGRVVHVVWSMEYVVWSQAAELLAGSPIDSHLTIKTVSSEAAPDLQYKILWTWVDFPHPWAESQVGRSNLRQQGELGEQRRDGAEQRRGAVQPHLPQQLVRRDADLPTRVPKAAYTRVDGLGFRG